MGGWDEQWMSWGIKHIHIVPNQQNCHSLPQLSHNLLLLLPCLPRRLTCLQSLETISNESLCHPPKVSTKRGMNTIPSASHRLLYFPILMFKECGTPLPPSSNFSNKFLNWSEMISCKKDFYSLQQKQMVFYNHFQNLQQNCPKGQFAQCTSGTTRCKKVVWRDNFQTISSWFGNSFLINSEFTLILWARLV